MNLDGEGAAEVRRYIIDNARMWLEDYHVDGLRLDAVHALDDDSETHLLEELAVEVAVLSAHLGRPLTLIAESDLNEPILVTPREAGGFGLDAQWSDDFHHALHVALTGETHGYYADFEPLGALAKVCEKGFFHDGTYSSFRERDHGTPIDTAAMPTWRLVVSSQNHDQVGNRAVGDRVTEALDDDQLACAALLTLCGPFTPMLFQGEEWAASTPFQFFTSHPEAELGRATAEGRIAEFARHGWDPEVVPDPQDPATFERSKLDWTELGSDRGVRMLAVYRDLARLRREHAGSHRPVVRPRRVPGGRGGAVLHHAARRATGAGELRRPADGRRGRGGRAALRDRVRSGRRRARARAARARGRAGPSPLLELAEVDDLVLGRRLDVELLVELAELQLARVVAFGALELEQVVLAFDQHVAGGGTVLVGLLDLDDLLAVDLVGADGLVLTRARPSP